MSEIYNLQTVCRCCHTDGNFKSLQLPYMYQENVEIYSNMLLETFDIKMNLFETGNTICDECIQLLRDAYRFKLQVIDCEEKFKEYCKNEGAVEVKEEMYDNDFSDEEKYDCTDEREELISDGAERDEEIKVKNESDPAKDILEDSVDFESLKPEKSGEDSKESVLSSDMKDIKKFGIDLNKQDPELEILLQTDKGSIYICKICGKTHRTHGNLKQHIKNSHKEANKCSYCSKYCDNNKSYLVHIKTHFKQICNVCGKKFATENILLRHISVHMRFEKYECDLCNKIYNYKKTLKKHLLWHNGENKKFVCDLCGLAVNDSTNLKIHVDSVHLKLRPFQCTQCDKTFKAKKHLKPHLIKHTNNRAYSCQICYKTLSGPASLKRHIALIHTTPVSCKICDATFESRNQLRRHRRSHIDVGKYSCHLCPMFFTTRYTLNRHIEVTHTGVLKLHACDVCNRKFAQRITLKRHIARKHNPNSVAVKVRCDLCKKYYRNIEKHLDSHNKRTHKCNYCPKQYPEGNTLNRHIKFAHLNIRPFSCTLCDKSYTKICGLRKHSIKIHKLELKTDRKADD